ncbi:MAG: AI-2E family transporter [Desulfamplus sp.]|nr:AI-2E family transporter [Desulfamplus sp.]
MWDNTSERAVFLFFIFLFCISFFLIGHLFVPFYATIVLGLVTTGVFRPFYRMFLKKISPSLSSLLTCVIIFFVMFVPVVFFVGILSKEAYDLYLMGKNAVLGNQLRQILENTHALEKLNNFMATLGFDFVFSWEELIQPVSELSRIVGLVLFQQASFVASNVFKIVFYFCLMLIFVYYLLIDGNRLVAYIYDLSPLPNEHNEKIFIKFKEMAGAVLVGNGLAGLIQGVIGGGIFFLFHLNSPFLWGVIMGFLAFLPIVGVGAVLIPTAIFLILKQKIAQGIFLLFFYAILSWSVEYIFKPKVVGDRVKMHPLIVFFGILGGLQVYGILGIIYGPLIVTLFVTLAEIYFANFQNIVEPGKVKIIKDSE